MSLLDEVTTQQVVYGPDGKAYGNPAIARNAGVNQYYREDGTPYPVAIPAASGMGSGDPYSQIMGQMGGATPYQQIMSRMPLLQNPYAGVSGGYNNFQGGYNPNLYSNPAAARMTGLLNLGASGDSSGGFTAAPSAWSNMSPAEQAAYYAANPTMAGITQFGQKAFGYTSLGALQKAMQPGFVSEQSLIAMGVNPAAYQAAKESFRADEIGKMNAAAEQAAAEAAAEAATVANDIDAISASEGISTGGGGGDGGYSGGTTGAGNDGGGIGAGEGLAQGGKVTKSHLKGPDPKGPDEGYGALLSGEYVIKKSAVNKYGTGLLDMINNGKIPAKKMKSLLG